MFSFIPNYHYTTRVFALLLMCFCMNSFYAQVTENELDRIYTPSENSPFSKNAGKVSSGGGSSSDVKNAIMFEPFWLGRSIAGGAYHRQLWNNGLIATFGMGKPFGMDQIFSEIFDADAAESISQFNGPKPPSTLLSNSTYTKGKAMLQIGLTYLFDQDGMDGQGLEFGYRIQRYQMNFETSDDEILSGSPKHDIAIKSIYCNYKTQWVGRGKTPFINSLSYGIGLKHMEYTIFDSVDSQFGGNYTVVNTGRVMRTEFFPTVMLSYSLGFGF